MPETKTDVRFSKCKPLLSFYGGKQKLASRIVPLLPEHTVYVEPFAGGAAILFAKPWPNVNDRSFYREVINDLSGDLINFYRVAQSKFKDMRHLIKYTPYSRLMHKKAQAILKSKDHTSDLARAWAYYVATFQSFGKSVSGGWGTAVSSTNPAATWETLQFDRGVDRIKAVYIESDDAIKIIRRWDSPQTLFYCDPPYLGTWCEDYHAYSEEDFLSLQNSLSKVQGSFVLSCYADCANTLGPNVECFEFNSHCSVSGKGKTGTGRNRAALALPSSLGNRKRVERVYRRFNTVPWRPELEKLRQAGKYSCFARNPKELQTEKKSQIKQGVLL